MARKSIADMLKVASERAVPRISNRIVYSIMQLYIVTQLTHETGPAGQAICVDPSGAIIAASDFQRIPTIDRPCLAIVAGWSARADASRRDDVAGGSLTGAQPTA